MPSTVLAVFFGFSNLLVAPAYTLMLVAPKRSLTQRYMRSLWWMLPLIVFYVLLAALILIDKPDFLAYWNDLYLQGGIFGSAVTLMSEIYGSFPQIVLLHGWVHIIIGDLFMARWVYLDALDRGVPAWMISIATLLIGFIGPIGVAIYLVMRVVMMRQQAAATTADAPPQSA